MCVLIKGRSESWDVCFKDKQRFRRLVCPPLNPVDLTQSFVWREGKDQPFLELEFRIFNPVLWGQEVCPNVIPIRTNCPNPLTHYSSLCSLGFL